MEETGFYILTTALILLALSWLTLLVTAFRTSFGWGISVLLVLPAPLFVVLRWSVARTPALLLGLSILTGAQGPAVVALDHALYGLSAYEDVVDGEVHLTLTGWGRADYSILKRKPNVVVLQMANADVTDETLKSLTGLKRLRELDLNDTSITDAGLATLATLPELRELRLRSTRITDAGFRQHLMNVKTLRKLTLNNTGVSGKTARAWKSLEPGREFVR